MTVQELESRAAERLDIPQLNGMQQAMASQTLPARILLLAPTGTGKTLAFALPFLASLPAGGDKVKGVVIAPTRELVLQIFEVIRTLASPEYKTAAFYGGHDMQAELASLSGKPDIIVATPGRLLDHLQRGALSLHYVRSLVLDEYDKSLELGFQKEMKSILGRLKMVSTLILTSATAAAQLPDFVDGVGMTALNFFGAGAPAPQPDILEVHSASADKLETLEALLHKLCGSRTLVFVNHREAADRVWGAMRGAGIPAGLYHGAMEQDMRERALIMFGNGSTPVLVATDLAARGLDIEGVDAVVHYHLPLTPEVWTHRNGRTARQGAGGQVYAIISDKDKVPSFVRTAGRVEPSELPEEACLPKITTLYINAGRREKISRGDVAGFILRNSGIEAAELGRIDLRDHCAYVAVPAGRAREIIEACKPYKLKGQRVRVSQIKEA